MGGGTLAGANEVGLQFAVQLCGKRYSYRSWAGSFVANGLRLRGLWVAGGGGRALEQWWSRRGDAAAGRGYWARMRWFYCWVKRRAVS